MRVSHDICSYLLYIVKKQKIELYHCTMICNDIILLQQYSIRCILSKMGRTTELNQDIINQTCEEIINLSQRPTIKHIRNIIGCGSETTIGKFLKIYLKKSAEKKMIEKYEVKINDNILTTIKKLLAESHAPLLAREEKLQKELTEANTQIQALVEENTRYSNDVVEKADIIRSERHLHQQTKLQKEHVEMQLKTYKENENRVNLLRETNIKLETKLKIALEQISEFKKIKKIIIAQRYAMFHFIVQ